MSDMITAEGLPSPDILRQLLRYDPDTGKLFWKQRALSLFHGNGSVNARRACATWNARYAGREAFTTKTHQGYLSGMVFGVPLRAHRVIWAIQTGAWPAEMVDHADGQPGNNKWVNLRAATRRENARNAKKGTHNTSGIKGVSWRKDEKKWRAQIRFGGRTVDLGRFESIDAAARAYAEASAQLHGQFGRLA